MRPYEIIVLYSNLRYRDMQSPSRNWRILTEMLNEDAHYQEAQAIVRNLPDSADIYKWFVFPASIYD